MGFDPTNANEMWRLREDMWQFTTKKWQKMVIKKRPSLFALVVTDIVEKSGISSFNLLLNVKFEDSQL